MTVWYSGVSLGIRHFKPSVSPEHSGRISWGKWLSVTASHFIADCFINYREHTMGFVSLFLTDTAIPLVYTASITVISMFVRTCPLFNAQIKLPTFCPTCLLCFTQIYITTSKLDGPKMLLHLDFWTRWLNINERGRKQEVCVRLDLINQTDYCSNSQGITTFLLRACLVNW